MSKVIQLIPADYVALLAEVKERVRSTQYAALKAGQPNSATTGCTNRLDQHSHHLAVLQRSAGARVLPPHDKEVGRTKNVLFHQVENQSYETTLLWQTNCDRAVTAAIRAQAGLVMRDEFTFDFLSWNDEMAQAVVGCLPSHLEIRMT